jgi:DNA-binding NtrC family response regulator
MIYPVSADSGARVLLVDDDANMVELVCGILVDDGFEVMGVTDTRDVLSTIESFDPQVVVLDEVMPQIDGLDLGEEIREHRPDQAIVIFSSLFDLRLNEETERLGFVYCEKAAGVDALEAAIEEARQRAS